jgi:long-chain acyl-CoA synthetase
VQIVAIIQWATGSERADLHALQSWCRSRLEAFKVPRQLWVHADWAFTASGKTDHPTLSHKLPSHLHEAAPCLTPLR